MFYVYWVFSMQVEDATLSDGSEKRMRMTPCVSRDNFGIEEVASFTIWPLLEVMIISSEPCGMTCATATLPVRGVTLATLTPCPPLP